MQLVAHNTVEAIMLFVWPINHISKFSNIMQHPFSKPKKLIFFISLNDSSHTSYSNFICVYSRWLLTVQSMIS